MWHGINVSLLATDSVHDSHAHYDRLEREVGKYEDVSDQSIQQITVGREGNMQSDLNRVMGKVVANFINPKDWLRGSVTELMERCDRHPKVYITLGCHPGKANEWKSSYVSDLSEAVTNLDSVVAIGECGLDGTLVDGSRNIPRVSWKKQKEAFKAQVYLAREKDLPLVIHLRKAEKEGREFLGRILERNHKIHRHCFMGNLQDYEAWIERFPNTYWSFTAWVTQDSHLTDDQKIMIRTIPSERLLVETDTPYFVPKGLRPQNSFSRPIHALLVAKALADLRNQSLSHLLSFTMSNLLSLYDPDGLFSIINVPSSSSSSSSLSD